MSFNVKRVIKKIVSWLGLFFFVVAAYMIYRQLAQYTWVDIKEALFSIPGKNLALSGVACFLGYVVLACYDFLALKYIGRKLSAWKWILAGIIGFSVSNNAGHAVVSGGAIRYRLYTRWRFRAFEIVKMVTFSGFTYLFGCFFLILIGYLLTPASSFAGGSVSHVTTVLTVGASAVGLLAYFAATLFYKKPFHLKHLTFRMPSFKMAWAQVWTGALDTFFASLVLYYVLVPFVDVRFDVFLGVFIIAQVLGVFSQVPGGLGVFEFLFLALFPGHHEKTEIFGALIAYRIIYYLVPLVVSGVTLFLYERGVFKYIRRKFQKKEA